MSHVGPDEFHGFEDDGYQHGMHTLAWASLLLIVVLGVGFGIFGFIWALTH